MALIDRHHVVVLSNACAGLLAAFFVCASPNGAWAEPESRPPSSYKCLKSPLGKGAPLDLTGARVTFEDEFDTPDITGTGGTGKWFAPIHGGFGGAKFLPYRENENPFHFGDGALVIRMEKQDGKWTSGHMQTMDRAGRGFSQQYGYFEMRAKLPPGASSWPSFWLKTTNEFSDPTSTRAELDIMEAYGSSPSGFHASLHLWPARRPREGALAKHWSASCIRQIPGGLFDGNYHLIGGEVTPEWFIIYLDRREIARYPTLPQFRKPLFVLVSLAYFNKKHEKRGIDPEHYDMTIDYVRVWQRP